MNFSGFVILVKKIVKVVEKYIDLYLVFLFVLIL